MSFRNFFKAISFSLFIATAIPVVSSAAPNPASFTTPSDSTAAETETVARITKRVYEIQSMDKTNLSSAEKKALKKELKEMKQQAGDLNQRVYLSVGAIIIIILLLILIL